MERRDFLQSLIAGGSTVRKNRKRVPKAHAGDIRLYHGPMEIPAHVYEAVREDPTPHRATGRGTHLNSRFADSDGTVYLFRCQIPAHRGMVGEIVQAPIGQRLRVHCWSAARPGGYRPTADIIAAKRGGSECRLTPAIISTPTKAEKFGVINLPMWLCHEPPIFKHSGIVLNARAALAKARGEK